MPVQDYYDSIAEAIGNRQRVIEDTDKIQSEIVKSELDSEIIEGVPQINVPELLEKRSFLRVRLFQAFFGQRPLVSFSAVKGLDQQSGIDWHSVAREMTDLFDVDSRGFLHIPAAVRASLCELVDYGLGGFKVTLQYDRLRGQFMPRWDFVSIRDILWPDSLGQDLQRFPWFGQVKRVTKAELQLYHKNKIYNDNALKILETSYDYDRNSLADAWNDISELQITNVPANEYSIVELWYTGDDGKEYLGEIHLATGLVLRDIENPFRGVRPYFFARLDERSALSFLGLGIGHKLGAVNKVNNALYNSAINAAIVALQQVKLVRSNSLLAKTLFGKDRTIEIGPNFQAITESPDGDLRIVPLGDPRGATFGLNLLGLIQRYSDRMFGTMDAQFGGVGSTRRAPASGIAAVMEEGSMPVRDILVRYAEAFREAAYFTLELYEDANLQEHIANTLGADAIHILQALALKGSIRKALAVDIKVVEPASARDVEQQRAMLQFQMISGWSQQLIQLGNLMANPQIPPSLRQMYVDIAAKVHECLKRALEAAGNIQDIGTVLPDPAAVMQPVVEETNAMSMQMQQLQAMMAQQGAAPDGSAPAQQY